jgi:hypothetical protein
LSFMDANRNHDVPVNLLQWVIYGCYINGSHLRAMSSSLLYWIFWELWCIIICSTDHLFCCWIIEVSPDLHQRTSPLAQRCLQDHARRCEGSFQHWFPEILLTCSNDWLSWPLKFGVLVSQFPAIKGIINPNLLMSNSCLFHTNPAVGWHP